MKQGREHKSGELERSLTYPEALHRRLSGYLLTRFDLGIGDTGTPADALYFVHDNLVISDYLTTFHAQGKYTSPSVDTRREALKQGESVISMEVQGGPIVVLVRPDRLEHTLITEFWASQGLALDSGDMVLFDNRNGVVETYPHPIQEYVDALPPIPQ